MDADALDPEFPEGAFILEAVFIGIIAPHDPTKQPVITIDVSVIENGTGAGFTESGIYDLNTNTFITGGPYNWNDGTRRIGGAETIPELVTKALQRLANGL